MQVLSRVYKIAPKKAKNSSQTVKTQPEMKITVATKSSDIAGTTTMSDDLNDSARFETAVSVNRTVLESERDRDVKQSMQSAGTAFKSVEIPK